MSAEFMPGTPPEVNVIFSEFVVTNPTLNFANWRVRHNSLEYNTIGAQSGGSGVILDLEADQAVPPGDVVSYAPPPADLLTLGSGIPVALFTDFPIT